MSETQEQQEIRRLRAALERYGTHESPCLGTGGDSTGCNCGLEHALRGAEPNATPGATVSAAPDRPTYQRLLEFFSKHALGRKLPPSCLVCGQVCAEPAISHMELTDIVVCFQCRDAAAVARSAARATIETEPNATPGATSAGGETFCAMCENGVPMAQVGDLAFHIDDKHGARRCRRFKGSANATPGATSKGESSVADTAEDSRPPELQAKEKVWDVPSGWRGADPWFKVGDKVVNPYSPYMPVHMVTEITERGFKYSHARFSLGPRYGWTEGGETFEPSHYRRAPDEPSAGHADKA